MFFNSVVSEDLGASSKYVPKPLEPASTNHQDQIVAAGVRTGFLRDGFSRETGDHSDIGVVDLFSHLRSESPRLAPIREYGTDCSLVQS